MLEVGMLEPLRNSELVTKPLVPGNNFLWSNFFVIVLLVTVLYWTYVRVLCRSAKFIRDAYLIDQFPGPRKFPLLGNGPQMIFKLPGFFKWAQDFCDNHGEAFRLWRLDHPLIVISSPELAIELLNKSDFIGRSQDIDLFYRQPGGNGVASCPGNVHTFRRKVVKPGFTRGMVDGSTYIFVEESKRLVRNIQSYSETGAVFNGLEFIMPCSFRIISRTAFGDDRVLEITQSEALEQMKALHTINKSLVNRITSPFLWLRNDLIYFNLTSEGREARGCVDIINKFGVKGIERRRNLRQKMREKFQTNDVVLSKDTKTENLGAPPCYLDVLLDSNEAGELEEKFVLGELNNYIAGGYDSSALTLIWTLFCLALNPSHQDKICEELQEVFGGDEISTLEKVISAIDTKKMKHMELCIKEALRMYPTVPVLPRATIADIRLSDGRTIPANTDVILLVKMIHHNPKYFPNPDQYIPERHLEPIPAFMPFSLGQRNCIGQVLGMQKLKVELAYFIREYVWKTLDTPQSVTCLYQGLLAPSGGIRFKIKRRYPSHVA